MSLGERRRRAAHAAEASGSADGWTVEVTTSAAYEVDASVGVGSALYTDRAYRLTDLGPFAASVAGTGPTASPWVSLDPALRRAYACL